MCQSLLPSIHAPWGFPGGAGTSGKEPPANPGDSRDARSTLGQEDPLQSRKRQPTPVSSLANPMDRGAWWATSMESQRVQHDWATKHMSTHPAPIFPLKRTPVRSQREPGIPALCMCLDPSQVLALVAGLRVHGPVRMKESHSLWGRNMLSPVDLTERRHKMWGYWSTSSFSIRAFYLLLVTRHVGP